MLDFLKKVFRGKKTQPAPVVGVETAPLSEEQLSAVTKVEINLQPPQLAVGSAQSVGRVRDHNEDTLFTLSALLADGMRELPFGIYIIADGMGGYEHGEVASSVAARTMAEYLLHKLYSPIFGNNPEGMSESIQEIMEDGVREAHRSVVRNAPGGGTTLTAALVVGEQVTIAHVGDSRAYFIYPDGRVKPVTKDHSLAQRLIELGQLNERELASFPNKNVLYRALGQPEPFRPDVDTQPFPHGGYMMLCSDGLWNVVTEREILRIITSNRNLSLACNELVDAANAGGGPDNISVILIHYMSKQG